MVFYFKTGNNVLSLDEFCDLMAGKWKDRVEEKDQLKAAFQVSRLSVWEMKYLQCTPFGIKSVNIGKFLLRQPDILTNRFLATQSFDE